MTPSGWTSFVYGIYLGTLGIALLAIPGPLLAWIDFPIRGPYWPRATGILAVVIAIYAIMAGLRGVTQVIRWSVYCRGLAFTFFTVAFLTGIAPVAIFVIGWIDLVTAIWSHRALVRESPEAGEQGGRAPRPAGTRTETGSRR